MTERASRPELLVPAGNMEKLVTAVLYGANAVYFGGQTMNLRSKAGFTDQQVAKGIRLARKHKVKAYYLLNAYPREPQLKEVARQIRLLAALTDQGMGPDAVIVSDPGIMRMVRKGLPGVGLHVSTQANTMNSQAARFWRDFGAKRVNMARELRSEELKNLLMTCRRMNPPLELEVFVHGAQCMALSGRCYLSAYLNDRSGNSGECSHPCRYDYRVTGVQVEEQTRKGEPMWEVRQAEDGAGEKFSQLFAANDLCLIHYLEWMAHTGVSAVKIEGRTKSSSYLAQVTDAYATALRDLAGGDEYHMASYLGELANAAHRPLTTGFFDPDRVGPICEPVPGDNRRPVVLRVLKPTAPGRFAAEVKARWTVTEQPVEILLPGLERPALPLEDFGLENDKGQALDTVHPGQRIQLVSERPELRPGLFLRRAWVFD